MTASAYEFAAERYGSLGVNVEAALTQLSSIPISLHCWQGDDVGGFEQIGQALGTPCVTNLWIPDGMKDTPVDRLGPRERLVESLDAIFRQQIDPNTNLDSVEGKLFGLGCESYTVGSHEFYLAYAQSRRTL